MFRGNSANLFCQTSFHPRPHRLRAKHRCGGASRDWHAVGTGIIVRRMTKGCVPYLHSLRRELTEPPSTVSFTFLSFRSSLQCSKFTFLPPPQSALAFLCFLCGKSLHYDAYTPCKQRRKGFRAEDAQAIERHSLSAFCAKRKNS